METFGIYSLGCKVNSYESNAIARMFEIENYQQVDFKDKADIYIINTCTVTNTGDAKSRKIIRQAIKRNPKGLVCVIGCYAQIAPEEIEAIEGVDIILGNQHKDRLLEYVKNFKAPIKDVSNIFEVNDFEDFSNESISQQQRAYLKIQEGCNKFCSYCIIPYARGNMRSRLKDSVINEAKLLVEKGYKEIVLTGIHTGGYGIDLDNYNFDDLLEDILKEVPDLKRLRISSIEFNQISERTIELIKNNDRLVNHLHIPLQAGSDEILSLMKREYTLEQYLNKINHIKQEIENIALTTDLIVGFPQESDEMFENTLSFIEECGFMDIHVFPYSKRSNTPAALMKGQISEEVKKDRVNKVIKLASKLNRRYVKLFINQVLNVIVEDYDEDELMYYGHSDNYIKVYFEQKAKIGSEVKVKLLENLVIAKGEIVSE